MKTNHENNIKEQFTDKASFHTDSISILLLDYYNAPQWLWGVIGCVIVILWIIVLYTNSQEKYENIFEEKAPPTTEQKAEIIEMLERALYNSEESKIRSKYREQLDEMRGRQS